MSNNNERCPGLYLVLFSLSSLLRIVDLRFLCTLTAASLLLTEVDTVSLSSLFCGFAHCVLSILVQLCVYTHNISLVLHFVNPLFGDRHGIAIKLDAFHIRLCKRSYLKRGQPSAFMLF